MHAGLPGIPLAAILVSWFFKYCFVVLDAALAGHDELPVLSVEMVNPFDEQRPLGVGLLIVAAAMCVLAAKIYVGVAAALALAIALGLLLPASIAVLGITGNLFLAAWPPRLFELLRGLGWDYVLLNVSILVAAAIAYAPQQLDMPTWAALAALQLLFLM